MALDQTRTVRYRGDMCAIPTAGGKVGPLGTANIPQQQFIHHWCQGRNVAMMGGWGVGKSRLIALIMAIQHRYWPGENGAYLTRDFKKGAPISVEIGKVLSPLGWIRRATLNQTPMPHWESPPCPRTGKTTLVFVLNYKRPETADRSANSVEGPDLGWILIDEANLFRDDEVARNAAGRVRSGCMPRIGIMGKPTYGAWWLRWANEQIRGKGEFDAPTPGVCGICAGVLTPDVCPGCGYRTRGVALKAPSILNRAHLPDFDKWAEDMNPTERAQNLFCEEQMPDGAVYAEWKAEGWPRGNLAPSGWHPGAKPRRTVIGVDFGQRFPAAVVMSHDPDLDAWVIWSEAAPDGASVSDLVAMLRRGIPAIGAPGVVPRPYAHLHPGCVSVGEVYGDVAGNARRDDAGLTSAMGDFSRRLESGGFGLHMTPQNASPPPERRDVKAGIRAVRRLVLSGAPGSERRRLLMWRPLWEWGQAQKFRTMARSLIGYSWHAGSGDVPKKDGVFDHHCDALRYALSCVAWSEARSPYSVRSYGPTSGGMAGMDAR